ncbi:radical SAM protein, putative [Plasmodium gallinaceum]|uniref:Threonylcarbamoyladenosine tRNA methylthiotransferase n=1 Tax=Plasmodium gallinaceum TaxID=5849 RepID=A0A1J1GMX5_PLAGA|nr:radical SAM protein, putative [Plasmodium gallinaceum]CRG93798.1 radical SAM protein, putative [Plasmodium gallinaceum]
MYNKIKILSFFCLAASGTYYIYRYKKNELKHLLHFLLFKRKKEDKKNNIDNIKEDNLNENISTINEENKSNSTEANILNENVSVITKEEESDFIEINNLNENEKLQDTEENDVNTKKMKHSSDDENIMTDVEDINNINDRTNYTVVQIKKRNNKKNNAKEISKEEEEEEINGKKEIKDNYNYKENNIIIPENYKIYFKSFGCAHNSSDSEFMMGLLSNYGFKFVKNIEDCDICIINSCTVKNPSEESMKTIINYVKKLNNSINNKTKNSKNLEYLSTSSSGFSEFEDNDCENKGTNYSTNNSYACSDNKKDCACNIKNYNEINDKSDILGKNTNNEKSDELIGIKKKKKIIKSNKKNIKIIVCGCVPQAEKDMKIFENISLVGVNNIDKIVDVVENVINGYNVKYLRTSKKMTSLNLPKIRKNKFIEIININNGCLGNCTYCKTKFARGDLMSYEINDIIDRVKYVSNEENIKEIWLTSEDTGAYGIDLNTDIVKLLKRLLDSVQNGDVMIRLGMTNPPYILKHIKDICNLLKHKNMYEFIHIPVQSGSNNVLKNMNREYNIEDFIFLVDNLRKYVPNITISTDIICGFPYETEKDHNETVNLIKKYKFPILNISQFYPRSGTVAFNMKKINTKIVKKRSREVTDAFLSYNSNYNYLKGTIQKVLFTELSTKSEHIIGHTKQYVKVLLPNKRNENIHLLGHFSLCKITSTHKWHVVAELQS